MFAWIDAVARQAPTGSTLNGQTTTYAHGARSWAMQPKGANGGRLGRSASRAIAGAFPVAIAALNRAGLGSFHADISTDELRRAGLRAMGEVARGSISATPT